MHPIQHFRTITQHRFWVWKHCCRAGIPLQGLLHDLSKYAPTEFLPGMRYYQGNRSPNEAEREAIGHSLAWMHHKGRNRHHFEYWTDYNPVTKKLEPVAMPTRYVVEMFCDRVAASKTYRGALYTDRDPLLYFEHGAVRRMIHPQTARTLAFLLQMLADTGEANTFAFIRRKIGRERRARLFAWVTRRLTPSPTTTRNKTLHP